MKIPNKTFLEIASKMNLNTIEFTKLCIDGSIFIFNPETLQTFWEEIEIDTPFITWVLKEIESNQLYTIDNYYFFMTS